MEKPDFDKILERKIEHYGHTKAAYQFAAEEYAILYRDNLVNKSSISHVIGSLDIDKIAAILKESLEGDESVKVEFETEEDSINYVLDVVNVFKRKLADYR